MIQTDIIWSEKENLKKSFSVCWFYSSIWSEIYITQWQVLYSFIRWFKVFFQYSSIEFSFHTVMWSDQNVLTSLLIHIILMKNNFFIDFSQWFLFLNIIFQIQIVYQIQKCFFLLIHLFYLFYQLKNLQILNLKKVENIQLWKHEIILIHHKIQNQNTRKKIRYSIANTAKIHYMNIKILQHFKIIFSRNMISIFSSKITKSKSSIFSSYKIYTTRSLIQIKVKNWMLKF